MHEPLLQPYSASRVLSAKAGRHLLAGQPWVRVSPARILAQIGCSLR